MDVEKRRNELSKLKQMLREAESGDAYAMVAVGSCYYTGRCGAEQDYAKALYWYTKAAERGNVTAIKGRALSGLWYLLKSETGSC